MEMGVQRGKMNTGNSIKTEIGRSNMWGDPFTRQVPAWGWERLVPPLTTLHEAVVGSATSSFAAVGRVIAMSLCEEVKNMGGCPKNLVFPLLLELSVQSPAHPEHIKGSTGAESSYQHIRSHRSTWDRWRRDEYFLSQKTLSLLKSKGFKLVRMFSREVCLSVIWEMFKLWARFERKFSSEVPVSLTTRGCLTGHHPGKKDDPVD